MSGVQRWRFFDPHDPNPATNVYTFPMNPSAMSSPFPARAVTSSTTTAIDGQALFFEGAAPAAEWTFSGTILDSTHHEALRAWVYDRRRRIFVYDHFGRELQCVLVSFTPTPKRSVGHYWRHDYEIKALVSKVGAPTVGLD